MNKVAEVLRRERKDRARLMTLLQLRSPQELLAMFESDIADIDRMLMELEGPRTPAPEEGDNEFSDTGFRKMC